VEKIKMNYALKVIIKLLENKIGKRTTQQIICVLLLVLGVKRSEIKAATGVSPTSMCKYDKLIREEKLTEIFEAELYRPVSELEKYAEKIEKDFAKKPPKTRTEASERIYRLTGIRRSIWSVGNFLKKRV